MTSPQDCRLADMRQFFTCRNPHDYHPDWKGYYTEALRLREEVLTRHRHHLGVRYGESPYHLMNVFVPSSARNAPVILYFHGGRWREGHPDFYDCLARPWVDEGAIFASCGYRLEPEFRIADAAADALSVINWWARHAAQYGGDPRRLIVGGHSAGGHLAAMAALTGMSRDIAPEAELSAAVIMSGVADLGLMGIEAADSLSPARHIVTSPRHVIVSYGSPEPNKKDADDWFLTRQGELLDQALTRARLPHQTIVLGEMDHVRTARMFSDPDSPLHQASHRAVFEC